MSFLKSVWRLFTTQTVCDLCGMNALDMTSLEEHSSECNRKKNALLAKLKELPEYKQGGERLLFDSKSGGEWARSYWACRMAGQDETRAIAGAAQLLGWWDEL